MKKYILFFTLLSSITAFSQKKDPSKLDEANIHVRGVCDMCKARIEKAAMYSKGVVKAGWNPANEQLIVIYNPKKTSVKEIEKSVAKAGHDTDNVKATAKDYDKLHSCCKYREQDKH